MVAAEPKTTAVTEYRGPGYTLLDLPGTLSGFEEHDSEAHRGVRRADALLIVTTTELSGESESAQIRRLLEDDGFAGRAVVVVNKANAENSDREVILEEVRLRLGDQGADAPVVFTDARDYQLARLDPGFTDDERALLLEDSGFGNLTSTLDTMLSQARNPRGQAHRHELARVLQAAAEVWDPTLDEQADAATAERLQRATSTAQDDINEAISLILDTLRESVKGTGHRLAGQMSEKDGSLDRTAVARAEKEVAAAIATVTEAANAAVGSTMDELGKQFATASESRRRYAANIRSHGVPRPSTDAVGSSRTDEAVRNAGDAARDTAKRYLRNLAAGDARAGSPAHDLAKRVNGLLRREPRPYVHRNLADKVQGGAGKLGMAMDILGPVLDGKDALDDLLRRNRISKKREEIVADYASHADGLVRDLGESLRLHVDLELQPFRDAAAPVSSAVKAQEAARAHAIAQIDSLRKRIFATEPNEA